MTIADRVRDVVLPLLTERDLELYDIEVAGRDLRVFVDRPGGLDLDRLAGAAERRVDRDTAELLARWETVKDGYTGDELVVTPDEKKAREVALYRQGRFLDVKLARQQAATLADVFNRSAAGEQQTRNGCLTPD